jgi:TolA-binding protein
MRFSFLLFFVLSLLISHTLPAQRQLSQVSPDKHFDFGLHLLQQGKFVAAGQAFERYLQTPDEAPKKADAQYYVAYCAIRTENADGEALIEKFVQEHPYHAKASLAYFELADLKYRSRQYEDAVTYFEKVYFSQLTKEKMSEGRFKLGYSYFALQQFDRAYTQFEELKRTDNKYQFPASYYAGYINFEKGEYDRAYYDFKRAEQNEAYAAVVPPLIVKVLYKQKRYDELIDYAQGNMALGSQAQEAEVYLYLGEAYYQKRDFEKAAENFAQYLQAKKTTPDREILFRIADTQSQAGRYTEAIEQFKQVAITDDALGQSASYKLGDLYLKTENKKYALAAFKSASEVGQNAQIAEEALFQYAKLNLDLQNFDEALKAIQVFKQRYPGSAYALQSDELLSEAFLNTKNYDAALKHIESLGDRSATINRAYQKIAFFKGTELFNNGQYAAAVAMFNKSLEQPLSEDYVIRAHFWKGEAYSIGRMYDDAIASYSAVFRADANGRTIEYLKARYGIGYAYFNTNEYEKALGHFRYYTTQLEDRGKGLNYLDGLVRYADCLYATKNYQEAITVFDQVIAQYDEARPYAYFRLGVIHGILNNLSSANKNFDRVIERYPNSSYVVNAVFQKAQFNFESGQYNESVQIYTRLIERFPESSYVPYALQRRAIAYANLKNDAAAARDYAAVVDRYPSHEIAHSALLGLQQALANTGRAGEFSRYLEAYKGANPESDAIESIEYEAAKNLYFNQEYAAAVRAFRRFMDAHPASTSVAEARYYMADALVRTGAEREALEVYYTLSDNTSFDRHSRVVGRIADLELALANYKQAVHAFRSQERLAQSKKEQYNAWHGLMVAYYHLQRYDSVDHYAEKIVQRGLVVANAESEALLYLGKSAYDRELYDVALDYFISTVNAAKDEHGAEAQYMIGQIYHKQKKYLASNEALYAMNANFSRYEQWLGRGFLLIADNFIAMDEDFQAKATLESIIENADNEEIIRAAGERLDAIKEKAAAAQSQVPDTVVVEQP